MNDVLNTNATKIRESVAVVGRIDVGIRVSSQLGPRSLCATLSLPMALVRFRRCHPDSCGGFLSRVVAFLRLQLYVARVRPRVLSRTRRSNVRRMNVSAASGGTQHLLRATCHNSRTYICTT